MDKWDWYVVAGVLLWLLSAAMTVEVSSGSPLEPLLLVPFVLGLGLMGYGASKSFGKKKPVVAGTQQLPRSAEGHSQNWFVATGVVWFLALLGIYLASQILLSSAFPDQSNLVNYGPELVSIFWGVFFYRYWATPFNRWVKGEEARRKAARDATKP